jgi:hypothetical protein
LCESHRDADGQWQMVRILPNGFPVISEFAEANKEKIQIHGESEAGAICFIHFSKI